MSPQFNYTATNKSGKTISGKTNAETPLDIAQQLKKQGYYIKEITKAGKPGIKKRIGNKIFKSTEKTGLSDLIVFTEQFRVMINAGIPLIESLQIISEQINNEKFKDVIQNIEEHIEKGGSLSEGLSKYPDHFPGLYCKLIEAGEKIGGLERILADLALHYKNQLKFRNKLKGALYYPLIVIAAATVSIIFLITFVVPGFVEIFASFDAELPFATRLILNLGNFSKNNIGYIFITTISLIFLLIKFYKSDRGKRFWDRLIFKIPFIGKIQQHSIVIRFSSTVSLLLNNGLNMSETLVLMEKIIENIIIKQMIVKARVSIREGKQLSEVIKENYIFPVMMVKMMKAGEEAGALPEMLEEVSAYFEDELHKSLETAITMIEPVLIIGLALVVGFIALSVILPMFNMYSIIA